MLGNAFRKEVLDLNTWELLVAQLLFVDVNELNILALDQPFLITSNREFDLKKPSGVEAKDDFVNECSERVKIVLSLMEQCVGVNDISIKTIN
jgi:hypothetical protein